MGKKVIRCTEEYTSKTVSWTGEIIENLGGRKTVASKIDGQKLDRDFNGARGIFIKNLSLALGDDPLSEILSSTCIVAGV